jgi:short-subunit dehydrogenase
MKIRGSQVLITGASRGIGLSLAKEAAAEGAHLHLASRTFDPKIAAELKKLGAQSVKTYKSDLAKTGAAATLVKELGETEIDILINNAGLLTGGLLEEQKPEAIADMLDVNLKSLILLSRLLLPGMLARKKGKIVNNSSVSGKMFFPCASTYAASKAGVVAFTESMKQELRGTGVSTLLLITPGVQTDMFDDIFKQYGDHMKLDFMKSIPAETWAKKVIEAIKNDDDHCLPEGRSLFGVNFAHHLPSLFEKMVKGKFTR